MSSSWDFDPVDRFTAGALGEPGHRVFYIQAAGRGELVTLLAEKEQISALAQTVARLLALLPEDDEDEIDPSDVDLIEPVLQEWRAGSMALDYDEVADRLVFVIEEALAEDDENDPATLRVAATRAQSRAMSEHAAEVVASGRPQCRICGQPMDPEGHNCPGLNGHKEIH